MSVMQGACAFTGKGSHVVGMDRPDPHYCCYKGNIIVALSQSKATPPPKKKQQTNKKTGPTLEAVWRCPERQPQRADWPIFYLFFSFFMGSVTEFYA